MHSSEAGRGLEADTLGAALRVAVMLIVEEEPSKAAAQQPLSSGGEAGVSSSGMKPRERATDHLKFVDMVREAVKRQELALVAVDHTVGNSSERAAAANTARSLAEAEALKLEVLVECVRWDKSVCDTVFATRVLLRAIHSLRHSYASLAAPSAAAEENGKRRQVATEEPTEEAKRFLPAATYDGSKEGYAFKNGANGLGYYKDLPGAAGVSAGDDCGEAAGERAVEMVESLVVRVCANVLEGAFYALSRTCPNVLALLVKKYKQ
jgi:hypothetical protein